MQLTPLQSRLAASLAASCVLLLIYFLLLSPPSALAAELHPPAPLDAHDPAPRSSGPGSGPDSGTDSGPGSDVDSDSNPNIVDTSSDSLYEPDFALFDRGIIGRAPAGTIGMENNVPMKSNIVAGQPVVYAFETSSIKTRLAEPFESAPELRRSVDAPDQQSDTVADPFAAAPDGNDDDGTGPAAGMRRRQDQSRTLYISANTCLQPQLADPSKTTIQPPQLSLYVAKSSHNVDIGPGKSNDSQYVIPFDQGYAAFNATLTDAVILAVSAPDVPPNTFKDGTFNFEVAVSVDQPYHALDNNSNSQLVWVDSDASATLFTSNDMPENSTDARTLPYVLFANNVDDPRINGVRQSYCGLNQYAQFRRLDNGDNESIQMSLKKRAQEKTVHQEFFVHGLNASSNYEAILVRDPAANSPGKRDNAPGAGGMVYQRTNFTTKPKGGACTIITGLSLCNEMEYAVPSNATLFPKMEDLRAFYDNYTQTMYDHFDKSLQQVQCEAPSQNMYSLVKGCADCRDAYKNWLCSVAIPRCSDFSEPDKDYLHIRNINSPFSNGTLVDEALRTEFGDNPAFNQSRNPVIDEKIQPGPYKELLPCDYMCYQLVQSCPAQLSFSCPLPGGKQYGAAYGQRLPHDTLSCNYPGSAHFPNTSIFLKVPKLLMSGAALLVLANLL